MVFRYFEQTDMLYIELVKGIAVESEEVAPNIVLDFDETNRVIGIEIEDAGKMLDLANLELSALPLANISLTKEVNVPA
ncbi:MAG: DUF2283 domain-containing protein [Anaerolineales bacterium]|nr:DUF2283 domain-containing protein [Anaerolineales bacterium]MCB8940218.1 DUF2283 domain-containing protein [Ardenticatenaceae bacterium]